MLSSVSNKQGKAKETVHMLIRTEKGQKTGFVIVAAEPKELTVVYIEGQINPDELGALGGNFGIPKIEAFHGTPQSSRKE